MSERSGTFGSADTPSDCLMLVSEGQDAVHFGENVETEPGREGAADDRPVLS